MLIYGAQFDTYVVLSKYTTVVDNMVLYKGIHAWLKHHSNNNLLTSF